MSDRDLEGHAVFAEDPYEGDKNEGYTTAYCDCGELLRMKTPKILDIYSIKCPKCGAKVYLYCGNDLY